MVRNEPGEPTGAKINLDTRNSMIQEKLREFNANSRINKYPARLPDKISVKCCFGMIIFRQP
jgi:hypothetical protein